MREPWVVAIVVLVIAAFLGSLAFSPLGDHAGTSSPLAMAAAWGGDTRSGVEHVGPLQGTLATHAGYCASPVPGCQNVVGRQWTDEWLAPTTGATSLDAWLNWTPSSSAASGLQLAIIRCNSVGSCSSNPAVIARVDGPPPASGTPQSLHLHAGLVGATLGDALVARVTSSTGGLPYESAPHASMEQPFALSGVVLRQG